METRGNVEIERALEEAIRLLRTPNFELTLFPTGSRQICPQVVSSTSDWDFVGFVSSTRIAQSILVQARWTGGSSLPVDGSELYTDFISMKKGDANLLLTQNPKWLKHFLNATAIATHLGLTEKTQRIALFQAMLYDNVPLNCLVKPWNDTVMEDEADVFGIPDTIPTHCPDCQSTKHTVRSGIDENPFAVGEIIPESLQVVVEGDPWRATGCKECGIPCFGSHCYDHAQ